MRFLIITYDEYINMPYIEKYENCLKNTGHSYDVILWDRRSIGQKFPQNFFVFKSYSGASKISKIIPFIKWRRFVLSKLYNSNYDKVIVLTTIPAVLLADVLISKFRGRLFFDIRDFTYENYAPYKWLVNQIVVHSTTTSISSPAFFYFLKPNKNIVVTHNLSNIDATQISCSLQVKEQSLYKIGFVGGVRYYNENICLLKKLGNKDKFLLKYIGKIHPGGDLRPFCNKYNIKNVEFLPAYENRQKPQIYQSIDLINAIYGSKSSEVKLALPNKLYDCVIYKKPILVSKSTYLSEIVEKYQIGLALDVESDDVANNILEYLHNFDRVAFEDGCNSFLALAQREEQEYINRLAQFCRSEE